MSHIVKATNLKKVFDQKSGIAVLEAINICIPKDKFVVIMGNSGSGKSTLLHLLSGMDSATEGFVEIDGVVLNTSAEKQIAAIRRNKVGFVFQDHNLMPNLTLKENILIAGYLTQASRKETQIRADMLMAKMDIQDLGGRFPSEVSGGQKQRFAVARAMINKPCIIMADEPTGNLNSTASKKVLECLMAARHEGQSVVMVTHDPVSASYSDMVMFMKDGEILDSIVFQETSTVEKKQHSLLKWLTKHGW